MSEKNKELASELEEVTKASNSKKKPYIKPELTSEKLMTFGAVCNGSLSQSRKAATGAPNFCAASRLSS